MPEEYVAKAGAERVLSILATLAKLESPVSMSELVRETGLAKSTLYRQLSLLRRWGFVIEINSAYAPGPMCLPLAWGFDRSSYLVNEAHQDLEHLSRASGESIGLMVAVNNQAVCLDMVESRQPLRCSFAKGRGLPLHKGASAKALLAFMASDGRTAALRRLQQDQSIDPPGYELLLSELDAIKAQGYAMSDGEVDQGIWGVSAPVFQQQSHAAAVVTLMAPSTRVGHRTQQLVDMTARVAARISSRLQSH